MRTTKLAAIRQRRLQSNPDAFDFSALIHGVSTVEEPAEDAPEATAPPAGDGDVEAPLDPSAAPAMSAGSEAPAAEPSPVPPRPVPPAREERLRAALDALATRLFDELASMQQAANSADAEEAGFYLSHANQILELLGSVDSRGDLARQLHTSNAPPEGRPWPASAWSLVEFLESPLSGLLPDDAGEPFVRSMLYAAWGIALGPPA